MLGAVESFVAEEKRLFLLFVCIVLVLLWCCSAETRGASLMGFYPLLRPVSQAGAPRTEKGVPLCPSSRRKIEESKAGGPCLLGR